MIKKILSQMGAAGGKTLQAIHSYPGTSDSIKEDLKDSKSNFNPPKRYQIFERIEAAETFDDGKLKGQTPYVGRLLGSGSFGSSVSMKSSGARRQANWSRHCSHFRLFRFCFPSPSGDLPALLLLNTTGETGTVF